MKSIPLVSLVCRPRLLRETASERTEIAALMVNCVNGLLAVASIALSIPVPFTPSLVAILAILFGPLVGLTVSSVYARIETAVGGRLGGKASFDNLYRLFAWSFLPLGLAALLSSVILKFNRLGFAAIPLAVMILLVFACCSLRNYCSNVLIAHEFSRARGAVSLALTFVMFIALITVTMGLVLLFFTYGVNDDPIGLMRLFRTP
ncbi:MAG: hypothetical protein AB1646_13360 [Thermodesulfobacteriota bacterium]